jgi:predicted ribosomally synthesized peptide with SipW-like signal peptide
MSGHVSATPTAWRRNGSGQAGTRARKTTRSARIRAGLALGAVVGIGTVATLAAWSDTVTATGSFSTGTLDLKLNDQDTTTALTSLAMTAAKPGDSTYALLTVRNGGTVNFGYNWTTSSTNTGSGTPALNSVLTVGVASIGTAAYPDTGTVPTCNATTYAAGTSVQGDAALSSNPAPATSRTLNTGRLEYLCVKAALPSSAAAGVQGQSSTMTMTVTATNS